MAASAAANRAEDSSADGREAVEIKTLVPVAAIPVVARMAVAVAANGGHMCREPRPRVMAANGAAKLRETFVIGRL